MKKIIVSIPIAFLAIVFCAFFKQVSAHELQYTVQQGDSLSSIAQAQLNDSNKWSDIYNLNKQQISNPNVIYSGEVLTLPADNTSSSNTPQAASLYAPYDANNTHIITQQVTVKQVPVYHPVQQTYQAPVIAQQGCPTNVPYENIFDSAASQYHVDPCLMKEIVRCESGFNPNALNASSGASGIAQFMPSTYAGSWNIYKNQYPLFSAEGQIYAMALKISQGGVGSWECYYRI
jgi:soluble lytic murein transglycosylase-like protein